MMYIDIFRRRHHAPPSAFSLLKVTNGSAFTSISLQLLRSVSVSLKMDDARVTWHDDDKMTQWHDDKKFRRRLTVWYNCSLFQKSCSARDASYVQCANSRHCVRKDLFCDGRVNCAWPHTALPAGRKKIFLNWNIFMVLFSFRCFVLCLVLSCSFYKSLHVFVLRNILSTFQMFPVDWRTCCLLL